MDEHPETMPPPMDPKPALILRRGKGCKRDPRPDHERAKDAPVRALFGAPAGLPAEALGLVAMMDFVPDQSITESCVGFAFAMAVYARCRKMGLKCPWPAPKAIYDFARKLEGGRDAALLDEGSVPAFAAMGMAEVGVPADKDWPPGGFDAAKINDEPDFEALEDASAFIVNGWYRVTTDGASRQDDVRQALANDYPVVTANEISEAFENYDGAGALGAQTDGKSPIVGGHATTILGYNTAGNYVGVTSWTNRWGRGGFYEATPAFVEESMDLYVVTCSTSGARR